MIYKDYYRFQHRKNKTVIEYKKIKDKFDQFQEIINSKPTYTVNHVALQEKLYSNVWN